MATDLSSMHLGELADRAKQAGIGNVEDMNKDDLVNALRSKGEGSLPGGTDTRGGGQSAEDPAPKDSDPGNWKNVPGNQS